ncbi:hypothetical protein C5B42_03890 [Candidatus Cerribacteria bacterium 'Amazon FNV 2010 28 9']|uniref:Multidrug resistance protein MdtA-like barrel-sandwich hybrid domain-containing protein n=1 Tax=Candidatus Cerribacteria bacterium 'Amazon FNV 2010 28 9' TaxID=2081795 RepID=A0A317JTD4_9BACT|nr:MAG: hypothetical protein C5B42_03890 [Candidatus Cerribacteria bacterium 'Amazon FNV 2010 28 9']
MKSILHFLRKRWYIIAIILIVVGVFVWRVSHKKQVTQTFISPTRQNVEQTVDVSGTVDATSIADMRFLAGGKLIYESVKEGDKILRGQTIASIDARDVQKTLQESLTNYMTQRSNFDQTIEDYKDTALNDTIQRILQKNQYSLNNAVADVELKNIAISNASLYSPFTGVVTQLPSVSVGSQVSATDTFEVIDPASIEFSGEVDEVDVGSVHIGQQVHIILDAYPNETVNAVVNSIAMKATASTKSSGETVFIVKASIPNADIFHTRVGMNGTMKIVTATAQNVLTVPIAATIDKNGNTYVSVKVQNGKNITTRDQQITTGLENDDVVEVKSGLSDSDQIVAGK